MLKSHLHLWWLILFLKLILAALIPLSADESYYWVWSQNLQLSYYDHPAMVAWLFKIGSLFPDSLIRWPAVILFHLGFLFWFKLAKNIISEKNLSLWFLACNLCPLLGPGSLVVTPDLPLFFFFSTSLYYFVQSLKNPSFKNYAFFGSCLGLGFLSKYTIVLPAALFYIFIVWQKRLEHLKIKPLLTIFFFGLFFSSPVFVWNALNDFKSFSFQIKHGLHENVWDWRWFPAYLIGTLLLLFPANFMWAIRARPLFSQDESYRNLFTLMRFLGFGGLGFFLLTSLRASVELNWPSVFYPCLFLVVALQSPKNYFSKNLIYWISIYAFLIILVIGNFLPALKDKLNEPYRVSAFKDLPTTHAPLFASTYQLASSLWWAAKTPVYKLFDSSRYDFFDEMPEKSRPSTKSFYFLKENGNNLPNWITSEAWKIEKETRLDDNHVLLHIIKKTP